MIFRLETPFLCFIQFFCRLGGKTLKEDYFKLKNRNLFYHLTVLEYSSYIVLM